MENKDKDSNTRQMCLCTGVLSNIDELILGMDLCSAIAWAVSSKFYGPQWIRDNKILIYVPRHKCGFAESHKFI